MTHDQIGFGFLLQAIEQRRPGRRYISEVFLVNSYDPDADLFDYGAVFLAKQEHP